MDIGTLEIKKQIPINNNLGLINEKADVSRLEKNISKILDDSKPISLKTSP